jgi:DNA-binding XRE family transcriptional regulator
MKSVKLVKKKEKAMKTIQQVRIEQGISKEKLAAIAGVSPRTIYKIEHNGGVLLPVLTAVCKALQIDPNEVDAVVREYKGNGQWQSVKRPFNVVL